MCVCADHAMCNAWILDGDLYHKGLQQFAVCGENLADTMALLVVDMSRPWTVLDSLQKWASVLREHIDKLRVNPETLRDMEQRCMPMNLRERRSYFITLKTEITTSTVFL